MSFLQRLIGYVVNNLLVDGLANSRTFQRFAVRSNEMLNEISQKGAEQKQRLTEQAGHFSRTFREEMKKGIDEQFKNSRKP